MTTLNLITDGLVVVVNVVVEGVCGPWRKSFWFRGSCYLGAEGISFGHFYTTRTAGHNKPESQAGLLADTVRSSAKRSLSQCQTHSIRPRYEFFRSHI